jgi:hypothetical protein
VTNDSVCWVCGATALSADECGGYDRCGSCGLRTTPARRENGVVDNGVLDVQVAESRDSLTDSQLRLVVAAAVSRGSLLDVGSGTGKFLYHARSHFGHVTGVEVSGDSVRFAKDTLHLQIVPDVQEAGGPFDVVTAWHSFEHIPSETLCACVGAIGERSHADTRVIVCVPNPDSVLARFFGECWAFRDVEAHLHEFSRQSLDTLFVKYGFRPMRVQRMWAYVFFAWVQSLCNVMPGPHNYLYYRLKRGRTYSANAWLQAVSDCCAAAVLLFAVPVGVACAAVEYALLPQSNVHVVVYARDPSAIDKGRHEP